MQELQCNKLITDDIDDADDVLMMHAFGNLFFAKAYFIFAKAKVFHPPI